MSSAALVLAAMAVGCGGDPDPAEPAPTPEAGIGSGQRSVLGTVDALQAAARAGDGRRICGELFTSDLARSVGTSAGRSCATEVRERVFSRDTQIAVQRDITVDGARATATIREGNGDVSRLTLRRVDGRWRIDRVTPAGSG